MIVEFTFVNVAINTIMKTYYIGARSARNL